jgi:tRNA(Leu) C34 or U34 (ribose-2'-O)-methylase TrmL
MFTLTTDNFTYEPASPGTGPNYLVTPRNAEGMSIELHYRRPSTFDTNDHHGNALYPAHAAWHLTEYDRNDEAMDTYWFTSFAAADKKAAELMKSSYDHDELMAGG